MSAQDKWKKISKRENYQSLPLPSRTNHVIQLIYGDGQHGSTVYVGVMESYPSLLVGVELLEGEAAILVRIILGNHLLLLQLAEFIHDFVAAIGKMKIEENIKRSVSSSSLDGGHQSVPCRSRPTVPDPDDN